MPGLLARVAETAIRLVCEALKKRGLMPGKPGDVRLVLSPHRSLHLFPLHACRLDSGLAPISSGESPVPPSEGTGEHLGERFEVTYTPSLSMLRRCARPASGTSTEVLLTGNPTGDLPAAEAETLALGGRYPKAVPSVRSEVRRDRILEFAPRSRRWNYSGHAYFNLIDPLESALLLESREEGRTEKWLSLRQVFRELDLRGNEMTFINGCEGALLRPQPSDDHVNLSTGMLYAGARCVVSTLWAVNDLSSALFSDRFHAELEAGSFPASALREAQRWLREDIRNGVELRDKWLPPLLARVKDEDVIKKCREAAERYASSNPDTPPFASPVHWAPFIASGMAFPHG
jgi:CHAT domain-containing protein